MKPILLAPWNLRYIVIISILQLRKLELAAVATGGSVFEKCNYRYIELPCMLDCNPSSPQEIAHARSNREMLPPSFPPCPPFRSLHTCTAFVFLFTSWEISTTLPKHLVVHVLYICRNSGRKGSTSADRKPTAPFAHNHITVQLCQLSTLAGKADWHSFEVQYTFPIYSR